MTVLHLAGFVPTKAAFRRAVRMSTRRSGQVDQVRVRFLLARCVGRDARAAPHLTSITLMMRRMIGFRSFRGGKSTGQWGSVGDPAPFNTKRLRCRQLTWT